MRKKLMKRSIVLGIAAVILVSLIIWIAWGNTALEVTTVTVSSEKLPKSFSGYRIAQISDLHNAEFGEDNAKLLKMLKDTEPDIIVITGDLVDSRRTDIEIGVSFAKQAVEIAPVYYVTGNHEERISEYSELKEKLENSGACVLENERIEIERSGGYISLIGIDDPAFLTDYLSGDPSSISENVLRDLTADNDNYTILLSHRPELFDVYADFNIDLVFSGHAHGGQFRLPFIGGVAAPGQGLFPKYDSGLYTDGDTNMIVSRGIGNSIIPFRINNRPEIVVVELSNEKN